jgi:hypothetical protein
LDCLISDSDCLQHIADSDYQYDFDAAGWIFEGTGAKPKDFLWELQEAIPAEVYRLVASLCGEKEL